MYPDQRGILIYFLKCLVFFFSLNWNTFNDRHISISGLRGDIKKNKK